ncbi:TetR/AcrR family transcriptional regulator [Streptomyces sp. NPDC093094]|uniref:TetR/AcrR family transcriptional regulator n=1 Tax=Streptomyces sp. NPDC093094 TaxID=3366026 RepID=UPI003819345D
MAGRAAEPHVIWTRPERTGRGPRPAYSRADITAAAVRLADAEGLDAVSMRRVAAELGCGTMSLYNYVPRKEDLFELMMDAAAGEHELAEPTGDWRADTLRMARQGRALVHRHPWMIRLISGVHGFSPNALRYLEWSLACLDPLDASHATKVELIAMVNGVVATSVANELAVAERARTLPWSVEQEAGVRSAYVGGQLASGEFPRLAAAFAEGGVGPVDLEEVFERVVGRVLDAYAPRS